MMEMAAQMAEESRDDRSSVQNIPVEVSQIEGTLSLHGGGTAHVRAIRPDDTERLCAFHRQLSPESNSFRFFRYMPELSQADAERFTHVDYAETNGTLTIMATHGASRGKTGLGTCAALPALSRSNQQRTAPRPRTG
jgi:hypothetical protein